MPENWTVIETTTEPVNGTPAFRVRMRKPNGDNIIHVMPQRTIDFRAAEYDIDATTPAGKQQIIDMILHEPFMDPIDPSTSPTHLYSAPTIADARMAHLQRVADAKANSVNVVWSGNPQGKGVAPQAGPDPLQPLLDHAIDTHGISQWKAAVFTQRVKLGLEKAPIVQPQTVDPKYYDPAVRRRGLTVALLDT